MSESVNLLDLACGRFPVNSVTEANEMVDKMIHYKSTTTFGNWRNTVCLWPMMKMATPILTTPMT